MWWSSVASLGGFFEVEGLRASGRSASWWYAEAWAAADDGLRERLGLGDEAEGSTQLPEHQLEVVQPGVVLVGAQSDQLRDELVSVIVEERRDDTWRRGTVVQDLEQGRPKPALRGSSSPSWSSTGSISRPLLQEAGSVDPRCKRTSDDVHLVGELRQGGPQLSGRERPGVDAVGHHDQVAPREQTSVRRAHDSGSPPLPRRGRGR